MPKLYEIGVIKKVGMRIASYFATRLLYVEPAMWVPQLAFGHLRRRGYFASTGLRSCTNLDPHHSLFKDGSLFHEVCHPPERAGGYFFTIRCQGKTVGYHLPGVCGLIFLSNLGPMVLFNIWHSFSGFCFRKFFKWRSDDGLGLKDYDLVKRS